MVFLRWINSHCKKFKSCFANNNNTELCIAVGY